jgi:hypothetical protein
MGRKGGDFESLGADGGRGRRRTGKDKAREKRDRNGKYSAKHLREKAGDQL